MEEQRARGLIDRCQLVEEKVDRFYINFLTSTNLFTYIYSLVFYCNYSKLDNDRSAVETSFFTVDFCHKELYISFLKYQI